MIKSLHETAQEFIETIENEHGHDHDKRETAIKGLTALTTSLLRENKHLNARLNTTETLLEETEIDVFNAELEIFNFQTQLATKTAEKDSI